VATALAVATALGSAWLAAREGSFHELAASL